MASKMAANSGSLSKLPRFTRRVMTDSTCSESSDHYVSSRLTLSSGATLSKLPRLARKVMTDSTCSEGSSDLGVVESKMATRSVVPTLRSPQSKRRVLSDSAYSDSSDHSLSDLKDANVRLRSQLDGHKSKLRQINRDKQLEVRQLQETSHTKLAIALKELRGKLHNEKAKEILQIKEAQQRKMETELHKIVKQKDMEIHRLQGDLNRLQSEMQDLNKKGLSGGARAIFVAERTRLAREVHELRTAKRNAEDHLAHAILAEKQSRVQLRKWKNEQAELLDSVKAGYEETIKTLENQLDDEKKKTEELEESLRSSNDQVTELTEKLNVIASHESHDQESHDQNLQGIQEPEDQDKGPPGEEEGNQEEEKEEEKEKLNSQASLPCEPKEPEQLDEPRMRVAQLEEQNNQLLQDKQLLEQKLEEAESHLSPMKEKVRNYLEKNMILSAKNTNIDEQLHQLKEDYHSLHHQLSDYETKEEQIIEQVKSGNLEEGAVIDATELNRLKECINEQDKTLEALKIACNEKDRRIEVLVQRQRNKRKQKRSQQKVVRFLLPAKAQSPSAAGVKETYFGYDDVDSLDSEISSTGRPTPSPDGTLDEDIADELSKAQYEQSYQRLLREHLELEKAFALLQAQSSASLDKETALEEEREKLCQTVKKLQEKVNKYRGRCEELQVALEEAQEQAEEMEFRLLEIQEARENGKFSEEREVEYSEVDEEALMLASKYASLKDLNVTAIIDWLRTTKSNRGGYLDLDSKHAGLQAETLIQNITNKLEDEADKLRATNELLNGSYKKTQQLELKAKHLEREHLELLTNANSEHTDLVFAHEQLVQQLEESNKTVDELKAKVTEFEKAEAIYKYTEEYNKKSEQRLTEEVATLRRQLTSSNAGRNYEAKFIKEKLELLKSTEQKLKDYQTKEELQEKFNNQNDLEKEFQRLKVIEADFYRLQQEHADLSEQYSAQRSDDEHSLAESDKDTATQLASYKSKVVTLKTREQDLLEKTESLLLEISELKSKFAAQEKIESQLKKINMSLQDEVKEAKDRIHRLLAGVESDTVETPKADSGEIERLRQEVVDLKKQLEEANQKSSSPSPSDDFAVKLSDLEKENLTLKNSIQVKDDEVIRLATELEEAATDSKKSNAELNQIKKEYIRLEDHLITAKTNIAQLKLQLDELISDSPRGDKINDLLESEQKLKEKCQTMEGAIQVLKGTLTEAVSKEKRTDDELKALLKSEISLRCQLDDYVEHATALEEKIQELEGNTKSLENELKKAELEKVRLANKLETLHDLEGQVKDLKEVRDQTQQLENVRHQLQEKIELLQASLAKEQEKNKEHERRLAEKEETTKQLQEKVETFEVKEVELKAQLESKNKNNEAEQLREAQQVLQTQVKELQQKLSKSEEKELQAKDALSLVGEEKDRRIDQLTDNLTKMEDKETRLMDTIQELEEMEKQLQAQLRHKQEQEDQLQEYETLIATLHEREREQNEMIDQLSESENDLRVKLAEYEDQKKSVEKSKGDKEDANRSYKDIQKIIELEAKIQVLVGKEARLLEQTHQLKMEKQEMQEHIEQIIDVDNLSQQHSPRADQSDEKSRSEVIEELRSKVKELEQMNNDLKSRLLQSKLDSIESTKGVLNNPDIQEVRDELKKVRGQLEVRLEENDELQTKLQKLRSENVRQESRQGELVEEVKRKTIKCEQLESKLELLTEAERKLMERVEQLEGSENKLKKEISRLKSGGNAGQDDEKEKVQLKKRVNELEEQVEEIQGKRRALNIRLSQVELSEGEEVQRLKEKIDLLSESEEKLFERIQELEEVEEQLRKQLATSEEEVSQLEEQVQQSCTLSKAAEELASAIDRISELEQELDEAKLQSGEKVEKEGVVKVSTEIVKETVTLESAPPSEKKADLIAEAERLQKKEKAYLDHIEELEQKLEENEEVTAKLREDLHQAQTQLQDFEEEMSVLRKEDKSVDLTKAKEQVQELEKVENSLRLEIREHQKSFADLEDKIVKLQSDHKDDIKEAHARIEELEDAEEQLQDQLGKVQQESKELKDSLNATKEEQANLMKKLEEAILSEKQTKDQLEESKNLMKDLENQLLKAKDDLKDLDNKLKKRVDKSESEEKTLKEDVSKLEEVRTVLQDKLQKSLENEKILQEQLSTKEDAAKGNIEKLYELSEKVGALETEKSEVLQKLQEVEDQNKQLQDKVQKVSEDENKIAEQLEKSQSTEAAYQKHIKELEENFKAATVTTEALLAKLADNENLLKGLNEKVLESVDREMVMKNKLQKFEQAEKGLKQKLEISVINENSLGEKVREMESKVQDYNKMVEEGIDSDKAKERLAELEENNKKLRDRITDHEKAESVLQTKWLGSIEIIEKLEKEKATYEQKLKEEKTETSNLKQRLDDLEKAEHDLQAKVKDAEKQNSTLVATMESLKEVNEYVEQDIESVVNKAAQIDSLGVYAPGGSIGVSSLHELDTMTKQNMMSRIQELEYMEKFHLAKISRLQENLNNFRVAVETVTVNLEVDADVPVLDTRPKTKDSEYEAKVQELVRSEVFLRYRVFELEKELGTARTEVSETKKGMSSMENEFKDEMEELEHEVDKLRKSEARLKNTINYGGAAAGHDGDPLAKIQHLESLVLDLESSERKLKRRIQELLDTEQDLRSRLEEKEGTTTGAHGLVQEIQEKDRHYELMTELKLIEMSDRDLKDKLSQLEKEDRESLILRIADMERKERALNRKIEVLEMKELTPEETSPPDSPEAVMKQRVRRLERAEKHLKTQVVELEKDREELHGITRKDKNIIHDLNVQLRELQLSENNLKEHVNRFEVNENHLQMKLDDLTEKLHDLEDNLRKQQVTERQLRAQLHKYQFSESDLNIKFEAILEDAKHVRSSPSDGCDQSKDQKDDQPVVLNEDKLRKKIGELEKDKRHLTDKTDELGDKVSELENVETTLKQKLRGIENNEASLQGHMKSLEMSETAAKLRVLELESLNEQLSDRSHKLEEEKAGLMYEMSELELNRQESKGEVNNLQHMVDTLKEKLTDSDAGYESLSSRLQDSLANIADLTSKLEEYQHAEREWKERFAELEKINRKYKQQMEDLKTSLMEKDKSAGLEEESSFLNLRLAQVQKDLQNAEEENMKLQDKLKMFETSMTNHQMATLPASEVNDLRDKEAKLSQLEVDFEKLKITENKLKKTIEDMRSGSNPCGHNIEIKDLKDEVNKLNNLQQEKDGLQRALNSTKKAHSLLKTNYEDVKIQLAQLRKKYQAGDDKQKRTTSNKSIQARLEQTVSLKDITPELKNALKNLGAKHPEVYHEFIRSFIPESPIKKSSQASTGSVKAQRVQDFVDRLPERKSEKGSNELWKTVESPQESSVSANTEETFWANIEKSHPGEYDDMTIGMAFNEESDNSESVQLTKPEGRPASSLSAGSTPPPLPETIPPILQAVRPSSQTTESYYLPSSHHGESADEASDIDEDPTSLLAPRAKSVDRDSDFESHTTKSSKMGPLSGSLDSIADSGLGTLRQSQKDVMGQKLVHLEKLLKNKEKELEMANVNMKELEKKLESFEPQTKTKREIHIHKQFTVNQMMEAEMSLIKPADTKQEEELQTLRDEVSRLRNFIKAKEGNEIDNLLMQKEKELKAKEIEFDQLNLELRKWQDKCRDAQDNHQKATVSLALLEDKVVNLQKSETQYVDLRNDHEQLEEEYTILKKKHQMYDDAETERADLEDIVIKLRGQLKDLERIELEREDLEMKLHTLENELKTMKIQESELIHENSHLKNEAEARKKEMVTYRNMEKDYLRIRSRFEELERTKSKAETLVTPLRAKVIRLAQKCRIKDDLIERLVNEIRRHGDGDNDLVAEADRVQSQTASEEYNRPLSPLETSNPAAFEETYSSEQMVEISPSTMLLSSPPSRSLDPDDLVMSHTPMRHSKPKKRQERPHSIELATLNQGALSLDDLVTQSQLAAQYTPGGSAMQYAPGGATLPRRKAQAPPTDLYTAIKDYEPQLFSESGHQRLELPLVEGQVVRILGPPDQSGYYEAEVNGKVGLVPGRYLAPFYPHPPGAPRSRHYGDSNNNIEGAPEHILSLHERIRKSHMPLRHAGTSPLSRSASITHPAFLGLKSPLGLTSLHSRSRPRGVNQNGRSSSVSSLTNGHGMHTNNGQNGADGAPEPPMRLEVQRVVGHSSLLLSWVPPLMDQLGCSNGLPVKGYKLYINGRDRQLLSSPYMTKALVENLNLQRPIQFTLQTVGQHGRMSRPVDTVFEHGSRVAVSHEESDISSVMSGSNQADDGERRVFLAVYDYNPTEHSPNSFPENELAFHTGDIITTYGAARSDGFYQAKVKGRRGLVPASFIQEVALVRSQSKRSGSVASSASQPRPSSQSSYMSNQ